MKQVIEYLKELKKKPYGKSVMFFGFYLILFIIIFIIISVGGKNKYNEVEEISGINTKYIQTYNYEFEYNVVLDNVTYTYVGTKNNKVFNYTYNSKEYYTDGEKTYIKEDSSEVENPIKFSKFLGERVINAITESAYIESKTAHSNGDIDYNLLISSNTLYKLLDDKDTDYEEVPNKVNVSISNKNFINEIDYDLNSYCVMNDLCKSLNITIKYKVISDES